MQRTLTFIVTSDCTRRCRYCYVVNKSPKRMTASVARSAVDRLLDDPLATGDTTGLGLDFIGGEPLMEAALIEEIMGYVHCEVFRRAHPWFGAVSAAISTNGDLYLEPASQRLVRWSRLEMMLSIDGPRDVHDLESGEGSYDATMRAFRTWRLQYPAKGTKSTLSPRTIPHLARSIMHLLGDLELPEVHANPVFEDVWQPGDAAVYERQLELLADQMLAADIPLGRCSLFSPWVGRPASELAGGNWCGAGKYMLAVGPSGDFYPCVRFAPQTLAKQPPLVCGNVRDGIDWGALEQFRELLAEAKSPEKCRTCGVAGGCAWCTGYDYDESGTILHRATNICELHKARARVNLRLRAQDEHYGSDHPRGVRGHQEVARAQERPEGAGLRSREDEPAGGARDVRARDQ